MKELERQYQASKGNEVAQCALSQTQDAYRSTTETRNQNSSVSPLDSVQSQKKDYGKKSVNATLSARTVTENIIPITDINSTPASAIPESASYKQIWRLTTRPLMGKESAYDIAQRFYDQFPEADFGEDLIAYLRYGYVISRPHLFCMARVVKHEEESAWYISLVVGSLLEAISCLPCMLPKLIFQRDNDKKHRVVNMKRFLQLAVMINKRRTA